METRIYRIPCDLSDGKTTIKKSEYVLSEYAPYKRLPKYHATTLDGKKTVELDEGQRKNLRSCSLTLKEKELFHMQLITGGWHDFYCIGTNPYEMWKRIIQLFNAEYDAHYNTRTIQSYEYFDSFYIPLCKIKSYECFACSTDADMSFLPNKGQYEEIGNYKKMYYGME